MTDDLLTRLRDFDPHLHEWEVVDEAADRIEGLEENQRFIIRERDRTFAQLLARAEKAEADNARLREAAAEVLRISDRDHVAWHRMRAALDTERGQP